jgi:hypothetical protein
MVERPSFHRSVTTGGMLLADGRAIAIDRSPQNLETRRTVWFWVQADGSYYSRNREKPGRIVVSSKSISSAGISGTTDSIALHKAMM